MASASPQADAESSRAYECEHVGCPNGCTTRTGLCASCARDRFAALRRVAEAAKGFADGWRAALPFINGCLAVAHVHGNEYRGPNLGPLALALDMALDALQSEAKPTPTNETTYSAPPPEPGNA